MVIDLGTGTPHSSEHAHIFLLSSLTQCFTKLVLTYSVNGCGLWTLSEVT